MFRLIDDPNIPSLVGETYAWNFSSNLKTGTYTTVLNTVELKGISTRNNPRVNGVYVSGGYFRSAKIRLLTNLSENVTVYRPGGGLTVPGPGVAYRGHFKTGLGINAGPLNLWTTVPSLAAELETQGSVYWNKLRPAKPEFDLALQLGELKDVPRMLQHAVLGIRARMEHALKMKASKRGKPAKKPSELSKTGEYFLALKFGWLPLIGGIRDFVKAQKSLQKKFDQILKDAGKPVRRKMKVPDVVVSEQTTSTQHYLNGYGAVNMAPSLVTQCYGPGPCHRTHSSQKELRTWAVGRFRYHLPPGPRTVQWKRNIMRRIMGSRITPSTLYNLMPWSWLVDYFSELGDFMESTSNGVEDRLTADYFYVMRTITWSAKTEADMNVQASKSGNYFRRISGSTEKQQIVKLRSVATPFGFGIRSGDLNPTQFAILGALGLSKLS